MKFYFWRIGRTKDSAPHLVEAENEDEAIRKMQIRLGLSRSRIIEAFTIRQDKEEL